MSEAENRSGPRRRVLKEAKIVTNHGHSVIDCLVRDMSPTGARLKVENGLAVPASFELLLVSEEVRALAEVVWRRPNEVGVHFPAAATVRAA